MEKRVVESEKPRRRQAAKKSNKKGVIAFFLIVCIVILCGVCFIGCNNNTASNVAAEGICVGDIELGGKTHQEVSESLTELAGAFATSEVNLSVEGKSLLKNIKAIDISLEFDLEKTVEKVFSESNKKGFFKSKDKKDVGYAFKYDAVALLNVVNEITSNAGGDLKAHAVSIDGQYVIVKSGKSGLGVSAKDAQEAILNSFKPYAKSEAVVKMRQTDPEEMTVDYLYELVKTEKKDAEFIYENGNVSVSDEVDGIELDRADAETKLNGFGVGSADVRIKLIITPAEVTKQHLQSTLFADVLGQYTTRYNVGQVSRTTNVELAGQYINGKVLLPGEVFSYNDTVGPRTTARGFKAASVYVGSAVESGLGGGICQTCSTLYPAVLYADLEVLEKSNHSLEVSYVPLGMDATVAWGTLDFKFKNSTGYPIKIQCTYGGGSISVTILGTKENPNKKVEVVTERVSYIPFTTTEVLDTTLQPAQRVSDGNGFNGSTVNTYKVYYENGVEVSRKYIGKSVYRMVPKTWRVGTLSGEGDAVESTQAPGDGTEVEINDVPSSPSEDEQPEPELPLVEQPEPDVSEPEQTEEPSTDEEYPDGV